MAIKQICDLCKKETKSVYWIELNKLEDGTRHNGSSSCLYDKELCQSCFLKIEKFVLSQEKRLRLNVH